MAAVWIDLSLMCLQQSRMAAAWVDLSLMCLQQSMMAAAWVDLIAAVKCKCTTGILLN